MIKKILALCIMTFACTDTVASKLPHGPNHLQAAPQLTSAHVSGSKTVIKGTLKSLPRSSFVIQFFNNPVKKKTTEGLSFLGSTKVQTNCKGRASFTAKVLFTNEGSFVSATATRLEHHRLTDTSEFSKNVQVN